MPVSDFGNPLATSHYLLCLYDMTGLHLEALAPAGGACAGKPCWKFDRTGYKYSDKELTPDGLFKIHLAAGDASTAKITITAKGSNMGSPPLPLTSPVTVQLLRSDDGTCWNATFSAPNLNSAERFIGRPD